MLPDLDFLDELADASARETLPRFRMGIDVDNKLAGDFDPVTEADRAAERAIRALINARSPITAFWARNMAPRARTANSSG